MEVGAKEVTHYEHYLHLSWLLNHSLFKTMPSQRKVFLNKFANDKMINKKARGNKLHFTKLHFTVLFKMESIT